MSYAILSDDLLLQLEGAEISRDARLLHIESIVYCATALTDGLISVRLERISDAPDLHDAADELIAVGLWERDGKRYRITDYHDHQPKAEEVERRRADSRLRAERSRRHKRGDHTMCVKGRYCPHGAVVASSHAGNAHGARDVRSPSLPIPSPPREGIREGEEDKSGVAAAAASGAAAATPCEAHVNVVSDLMAKGVKHVKSIVVDGNAMDVFDDLGKPFSIMTNCEAPFYVAFLDEMPDSTFIKNSQPEDSDCHVLFREYDMTCFFNLTALPVDERASILLEMHDGLTPYLRKVFPV
jgi:hypothetical protein